MARSSVFSFFFCFLIFLPPQLSLQELEAGQHNVSASFFKTSFSSPHDFLTVFTGLDLLSALVGMEIASFVVSRRSMPLLALLDELAIRPLQRKPVVDC